MTHYVIVAVPTAAPIGDGPELQLTASSTDRQVNMRIIF